MKNLTWISDLKLRGSWGMLGNSNISPYQYQSTVNFAQMWYYLNDSKVTGALPTTPANPDVKWETQYSTDLGLDLSVLDSRLLFTVDYYYKKTKDMLIQVPISFSAGYMGNFPTLKTRVGNLLSLTVIISEILIIRLREICLPLKTKCLTWGLTMLFLLPTV